MKTSLRKLRGFASLHKNADLKEKRDYGVPARQDELLQASQDVIEMRNCYDSLLSAAAATANSAYEFSEALREMGTCLLEKTSLNDDEESSRVLLILGKAQFELQKLVDSYRVHIIQTITTPSESLLKELQTVEEMKRQCDDKRDLYKFILAAQREKGRTRHGKGESFESQQLQAARDDYEEEANLFVFRLKSLKQGQSRSLLTQAARHHAAQLNFFRKGVKSLEMLEPHVKVVAEQQHIDYDFIGLEDDDTEDDEDSDCGYDGNDDGELSFDYSHIEHIQDVGSTNRKSMELDQGNVNGTTSATSGTQLVSEKSHGDLLSFAREPTTGSQSAPILPEKKFELSERIKQIPASSPMRFHTYVLPTPVDARNSVSAARPDNKGQWPKQLWHSSPLEPNKPAEGLKDELSSPKKLHISHAVLKDRNIKSGQIQLPPPVERLILPQSKYNSGVSDSKKIKRQAFSGPLIGKSLSSNPRLFSETIQPADYPPGPSFTAGRVPSPQLSLSPSASPFPMLSSEVNELHELPRPPIISARPVRTSSLVGHSGPLVTRSQGLYATSAMLSNTASPLPTPPPVMARSFSIPSSVQRSGTLTMANFLEDSHNAEVFDEVSSPPLTLISLANNHPPKDPNKMLLVPSYKGSYD
ncbi:uncharacterized protein At2g33490-like [Dendrobium catenatum]|uniref:uncharacterized protein At2g33490-like n=1 Tax=Dendrobium catenatum TaxID=906689 RepID=UPI0009F3473C|nr:uncharacterized protein At2g33490-like [Dendrobium catenatum]